jgi:hypothetical protein
LLFIAGAISQGHFARCRASAQRMVDFIAGKPVARMLGTHVETTSRPFQTYPYGTGFQPLERDLQLERRRLVELNDAVRATGGNPVQQVHADFLLQPI